MPRFRPRCADGLVSSGRRRGENPHGGLGFGHVGRSACAAKHPAAAGMTTHRSSNREIGCSMWEVLRNWPSSRRSRRRRSTAVRARSYGARGGDPDGAGDERPQSSGVSGSARRTDPPPASRERGCLARMEMRAVGVWFGSHRRRKAWVGHSGWHATCDRGRRLPATAWGPDGRRSMVERLQRWSGGGHPGGGCRSSDLRCVDRVRSWREPRLSQDERVAREPGKRRGGNGRSDAARLLARGKLRRV
jgi:hypothetical protein